MDVEQWEEPGFLSRCPDSKAGPAALRSPFHPPNNAVTEAKASRGGQPMVLRAAASLRRKWQTDIKIER